jgi:signal peptidase II
MTSADLTAVLPPTAAAPAWRSVSAWVTLLVVVGIALALDLGTKAWTFATVAPTPVVLDRERLLSNPMYNPIDDHIGIALLPAQLLDLHLVINRGAVFGIGPDRRGFLVTFTIVALAAAIYLFAFRTARNQRLAHVAIGLIIAGGFGNLYDRIRFGVVRDFLHMVPGWRLPFGWHYPRFLGGGNELFPWVFNLADVMLLTGMGLLLLHLNLLERRKHKAPGSRT